MVAILRNVDGTIKTFSERGEDFVLLPGESLEGMDLSFAAYAGRLRLSAGGRSGETLFVSEGMSSIDVQVDCPGQPAISLDINHEEREVALDAGRGSFSLALKSGATYIIRPHDCTQYCAAGEAVLVIVVEG